MTTLGKLDTDTSSIFGEELNQSRAYRILGLINGLLLGLALALGAWGISGYSQSSLPVRLPVTSFVLVAVLVLLFTGTAGWLTARFGKGWFTVTAWLITAVLIALLIGYETSHVRTFLVWLVDGRFRGLPIYPLPVGSVLPILIAGFFIMLVLGVLAFAQDYRLEGAYSRLGTSGGISFSTLLFLSLPLPIVILAGFITNDMVGGANATFAIQLVDEAFRTGRTYEGDLFELSLEQGVNYNAIKGVREMMSANYTLGIAGFEAANSAVIVSADFDNGAWINCRVVNEQLGFCSDASPPYAVGFANLIAGREIPEDCIGCRVRISEQWQSWLSDRAAQFGSDPQVEKVDHWGSFVLVRINSSQGEPVAHCWFQTVNVIEVEKCEDLTAE